MLTAVVTERARLHAGLVSARKQLDKARVGINRIGKQIKGLVPTSPDSMLQRSKHSPARKPYSVFLSEPFIKVSGKRLPFPFRHHFSKQSKCHRCPSANRHVCRVLAGKESPAWIRLQQISIDTLLEIELE